MAVSEEAKRLDTRHLGDGVYMSDDGFGLLVTANHHDPEIATDKIWLEPDVIEAMLRYVAQWKKMKEKDDESD